MSNYRRAWVPGGTYFFTVNLLQRQQRLLVDHVDNLRGAFRLVKATRPFEIVALVVLPDHLHCIWCLPPEDQDYATRWRHIKTLFSRSLTRSEARSPRRLLNAERGIWQRRYWEHCIRNECDLAAHIDYIHFNPVKHRHVTAARDWPHSTFHRYVARGQLPLDWATPADQRLPTGERDVLPGDA